MPGVVMPGVVMRRFAMVVVPAAALVALVLMPAAPAAAHPLGNFSVNQYVGLTLHPDRIDARAVIDLAEIPTLQEMPTVDKDGSGTVSDAERAIHASDRCSDVAASVGIRVGGAPATWTVVDSSFTQVPGAGGLDVSRLSCSLSAPADLSTGTDLTIENTYLAERIGWREMTAAGAGVGLIEPALPAVSVTDELRTYPADPLASPLDVRTAALQVTPSSAVGGSAASGGPGSSGGVSPGVAVASGGDPVSRWMAAVDGEFRTLAGGPLTPVVVLLTVGLALLLGAGHAALPGHGKTVLAAYLAGKRGRPRDAVVVAGTVTLTHTAGVLALGLLLTAGTAIAGDQILGWLGLASGVLVLGIGAGMVVAVLRGRRPGHGHDHDHATDHAPDHAHDYAPDHGHLHGHDHPHGHSQDHGQSQDHGHRHESGHDHSHGHIHLHASSHPHDHGQPRDHPHDHGHRGRRARERFGLAGIGVAGGLVPSPSALIVLLAAIGLGRAGYGVLLVVIYGAGMALTLTGAGLLLLALQRRMARRATAGGLATWLSRLAGRVNAATPAATAGLVLLVGAGLAVRAAAGIV